MLITRFVKIKQDKFLKRKHGDAASFQYHTKL